MYTIDLFRRQGPRPSCCSSSPTSNECSGYPLLPFDVDARCPQDLLLKLVDGRIWFLCASLPALYCVPPRTCSPWMTNIHNTMLASVLPKQATELCHLTLFLCFFQATTLSLFFATALVTVSLGARRIDSAKFAQRCFFKYSTRQYATTVTYLLDD
jgi:hypothetical protein